MKRARIRLYKIISLAIILFGIIIYFEERRTEATLTNGKFLILVNDDYYVPEDYEVELLELRNGEYVSEEMYPYLQEMFDAARAEDVYMIVRDGYRSYEEQQEVMDEKIAEYKETTSFDFLAKHMAEKWVAIPGTSEHQLGLAVDINADIYSYGTQVYEWLANNAHKYGFIQRYPEDKVYITGISYEPWHYRYVGVEAATEIHEKGICLEEYIDSLK